QLTDALESTGWMAELSPSQMEMLARHFEEYLVEAGRTIFRQGASEGFMCLVVDGEVDIRKENSAEDQAKLARFGRGKAFGEMALVDNEPRSASAIAVTGCRLLVLTREGLEELAFQAP